MPRKRGQPAYEPTNEERLLVEQMTAVGIPQESVAMVLRDGIDLKTLRKHFRRELDTAKIKANAKVGGTLFNKIMNGDTTALQACHFAVLPGIAFDIKTHAEN